MQAQPKPFRTNAFTLIELLIVVAIIAILAAIAVPNFLEAQTRSKVSRCKTDMRTIAVAVNAYSVDWNREPIGIVEANNKGLWTTDQRTRELAVWSKFTTPVAYLTSVPQEPFNQLFRQKNGKLDANRYDRFHYFYQPFKPMVSVAYFQEAVAKGYYWQLLTHGPSRWNTGATAAQELANGTVWWVYDPSNGTVTPGMIVYTNKGFYPKG